MALRFRLNNGLTVIFEEQHAAKVVAFEIWVKAGSADERPDQAGLAHLHEHMLFKGTERRGPGEMAHILESLGGEVNAWTSFDQTVYHVVMASQFAQQGLDVLGDAVRHPAFNREELAREIEVVCEEIKRSEDSPSRRASRQLFSSRYHTHPYHRPVIGWEETVRGFTREKVMEFYLRHYTPDNMVLVACGDITEPRLRGWAEEVLGGAWGRTYAGPVTRAAEPPVTAPRVDVKEEDVKEVYLNLAFAIPPVDHPDSPALDLLATLLGQGDASRLSLEVKRKRSLVNHVHAYAYTPKDAGLFALSLTCPPATALEALELSTATLLQIRGLPAPAEELATLKALVEAEAVYQRETVQGLARKLGFYETGVGGIEAEARYYEKVAALTPQKLVEVAQRYLNLDRAILTAIVPNGSGLTADALSHALERAVARPLEALPERRLAKPSEARPLSLSVARSSSAPPSGIIVERLASGATVLVREERTAPLFAVRAAYLGGLRYETEANNGLTALLCRMMTRGTVEHDAEQISHQVDELAGSLSAAQGRNTVGMRGEFLSRHFDRAFSLFAECLSAPAFPEAELTRERGLLLQDIHTRDDKPSGLAFELFARTLFTRHPYRMPSQGDTASVERLTSAQLAAYHAQFMDPSQLTLCVVGDVRAEEVLERAREAFGRSRTGASPVPTVEQEPGWTGPRFAKRTLDRAQSHLVMGFPGVTLTSPLRHPLDVLSTVLSGQGGRLFLELRDKRSMAYSVSSFTLEGLDPGYFAVYMGTSPEKVAAAVEGIRAELIRVRDELIPEPELARARQHLIGTHEIGLQRNGARAGLLALDHIYGLGESTFLHYAEEVGRVTAAEVQAAAKQVIDFERCAQVVVGP